MGTPIDLGGNDVTVNSIAVGAATPGASGTNISGAEIAVLDGVTPGTAAASKAVVLDSGAKTSGIKNITLAAGTATVAPIVLTAGTNLTAATAGSTEFDGKVFYDNALASTRQLRVDEQFTTVVTSPVSLGNDANPHNIFNTGGAVVSLAAGTTYRFEGYFHISTGATTHTTALGMIASSAFTSINYLATLYSGTSGTINTAAPSTLDVAVSTATVLNATSTAPCTIIYVEGIIRTNLASTLTPQVTFSANPTGTCQTDINSWFRIYPVGSGTVQAVGNWA